MIKTQTLTRIYQAIPLKLHALIHLDREASHHLAHVLRVKIGDKLRLFNGDGIDYEAIIKHIDKKSVAVLLINEVKCQTESPVKIYLAQGMARGEKMDLIIQKAVELGVNKIMPLVTERCNVRLNHEREEKRLIHWRKISISACEQSGRQHVPEVDAPMPLNEWLPSIKANLCFVLSPHVPNKFPLEKRHSPHSIVLLIGPEGGLSEQEVKMAIEHGFLALNLGPRVLRTETATMAAMSILQFYYGDM